jgi:hypothetical protein
MAKTDFENINNLGWDFFEDIYEKVLKKGQTFSYDMGDVIQKELEKMQKQKEDWLKNKEKGDK